MLSKPKAGDFCDKITENNSEIENWAEIIWSSGVSFGKWHNVCGLYFSFDWMWLGAIFEQKPKNQLSFRGWLAGWTIPLKFLAESQNTENGVEGLKFGQNVYHANIFWNLWIDLVLAHSFW